MFKLFSCDYNIQSLHHDTMLRILFHDIWPLQSVIFVFCKNLQQWRLFLHLVSISFPTRVLTNHVFDINARRCYTIILLFLGVGNFLKC